MIFCIHTCRPLSLAALTTSSSSLLARWAMCTGLWNSSERSITAAHVRLSAWHTIGLFLGQCSKCWKMCSANLLFTPRRTVSIKFVQKCSRFLHGQHSQSNDDDGYVSDVFGRYNLTFFSIAGGKGKQRILWSEIIFCWYLLRQFLPSSRQWHHRVSVLCKSHSDTSSEPQRRYIWLVIYQSYRYLLRDKYHNHTGPLQQPTTRDKSVVGYRFV